MTRYGKGWSEIQGNKVEGRLRATNHAGECRTAGCLVSVCRTHRQHKSRHRQDETTGCPGQGRTGFPKTHLVVTRPHQGIIAQVAADVGRDDLAIDAITGDEVLVLTAGRSRGATAGSRHVDG